MVEVEKQTSLFVDIGDGVSGHRAHYGAMLPPLIDAARSRLDRRAVLAREPILISMIEESLSRFALTCLVRSGLGRVTAGLLFRPLPPLRRKGLRYDVKRWVLQALKATPGVRVLTILPFAVEPDFARIATGWIHDPQFWDLFAQGAAPVVQAESAFAAQIRAKAAGRRIYCAIGRQDQDKGFDHFVRLWVDNPALRETVLFVYGGKVTADLAGSAKAFADAGGLAFDRFIDDQELFDLYAVSDMVWSCYAPHYDQASGIFGRAMQLGIPAMVRAGSLIHRIALDLAFPHVAIGEDAVAEDVLTVPPREDPAHVAARGRAMAAQSMAQLRQALGLAAGG